MLPPGFTHSRKCFISDPINVIFREISIEEISVFLLSQNWSIATWIASNQYIPFPSIENKQKQDTQLVSAKIRRYHIRIWNIEKLMGEIRNWNPKDKVIGSVHFDLPRLIGFHTAADFETPKQDFARLCSKNSKWRINPNQIELGNRFAGYQSQYNDGRAALVEPANNV